MHKIILGLAVAFVALSAGATIADTPVAKPPLLYSRIPGLRLAAKPDACSMAARKSCFDQCADDNACYQACYVREVTACEPR